MLPMPKKGFSPSTEEHNSDIQVVCDWLEASILFSETEISMSDIVDILRDEHVYTDQDFAFEFLAIIWQRLEKRAEQLGKSSPFVVDGRMLRRTKSWKSVPGHSFCMTLTLGSMYKEWAKKNNVEYIKQGHLFERLTKEALTLLGWHVLHTGWSSGIQNDKFKDIVKDVSVHLNETYVNEPLVDIFAEAKEEGLDLVCSKPFRDGRGGKPIYLVQCASGEYWRRKRDEPSLSTWNKLIGFSCSPQKAFVFPYTEEDDDFMRTCIRVNGMTIDRYRLLSAGFEKNNWVSNKLKTDLNKWIEPRIAKLATT